MRRIKAVVYGVGAMNTIATRLMLEKGVDIVGALARSPEKVGRDLGEVAGLGYETGVVIENDPEKLLSTRQVDIAVIAVASYMSDMYEHLRLCAEHGVNAVTIAEEALYPWNTSPMQTAELDHLARHNGCHAHRYRPPGRLLGQPGQHGHGDVASAGDRDRQGQLERRRLRSRGGQGPARRHDRRGLRPVAGRDRPPPELRQEHARRPGRRPRGHGDQAVEHDPARGGRPRPCRPRRWT